MTRFMKVAGAASVLALAYAANADQQQVEIKAYVPGYCNISYVSFTTQSALGYNDDGKNTILNFSPYGHNFFVKDGTGQAVGATVNYSVVSNDQCNYSLTSANGGLRNSTTGFIRDYYAHARPASGAPTPVHLASYSPNAPVGDGFSIPVSQGQATHAVVVQFDIPASGILQAGEYRDVLYLTVNPAH